MRRPICGAKVVRFAAPFQHRTYYAAILVARRCPKLETVLYDHLSAATFAVVDVETTGLDPRSDRVVEVACIRVTAGRIVDRFNSLVNPGIGIPPQASAIHGIVDRDVARAPVLADVRGRISELARGATVVAHNARFDLAFLPFIAHRPTLCTLRLARRLVAAPNYKNETLRAVLDLDCGRPHAAAHRAETDAEVTAALLLELLRRFRLGPYEPTVGAVLATLARPAYLERFTFGTHRGTSVTRIPTGYLRWIVRTDFENWPDVRYTALAELGRRGMLNRSPARRSEPGVADLELLTGAAGLQSRARR